MDPRADEVFIEDIAHALSMQCRYAGHCLDFYSVAEHCVLLSERVQGYNALWALLHDASEAYLVDVPRPVKPFLTGYKPAEEAVMRAVCERFGLPTGMPSEVHWADNAILRDELNQNMATPPEEWNIPDKALGVTLQFWTPRAAKTAFMQRFADLTRRKTVSAA